MKKIKLYPVTAPDGYGVMTETVGYSLTREDAEVYCKSKTAWPHKIGIPVDGVVIEGVIYVLGNPINDAVEVDGKLYHSFSPKIL